MEEKSGWIDGVFFIHPSRAMLGVRDYGEGFGVEIGTGVFGDDDTNKRECVVAFNEGGCNGTLVDLEDVIEWVKKYRPELLSKVCMPSI